MRFREFEFPQEPEQLQVAYRRQVVQTQTTTDSTAADGGSLRREVTGSGRFMGADAQEQFERLQAQARQGGPGALTLPGEPPFWALVRRLEKTGQPHPHAVRYAFVFEECAEPAAPQPPESVRAAEGETLWDIAFRYGMDVEKLIARNPQIPKIRRLTPGATVYVRG